MKRIKSLALKALSGVSMSCSYDDQGGGRVDHSGIFKGTEAVVYDVKAWTWVELNARGEPEKVAISIDQQALNSMPVGDGQSPGGYDPHNNLVLPFDTRPKPPYLSMYGLTGTPMATRLLKSMACRILTCPFIG